jgi:hypothetical protein
MNTNPRPIPDAPLHRPFGRPLCPVPGPGTPDGRLDAGGTRLRLRALHVMGHGSPRLARALGVRKTTIQELVGGKARTVSPHLLDAITDLYEAWWDKRAPERTRAERAAAAAARKRAIAGLVRSRRPRRRPARRPRLPPPVRLETRHRHRRRPRHPPARTPSPPKEGRMTSDDRLTGNLFLDILGVLERHGYRRSDNYHAEQDAHPQHGRSSTEAAPDAVVVSGAEAITMFAALDIAADDKRYRVGMCPDCPDQSCPTCQTNLRDAHAFDQMADRMLQAARTAPAAHHGHAEPPDPFSQPSVAADKEAGQ